MHKNTIPYHNMQYHAIPNCIQGELRNPGQSMCLDSAVRPDNMHKPVSRDCCYSLLFVWLSVFFIVPNDINISRRVCGLVTAKKEINTVFSPASSPLGALYTIMIIIHQCHHHHNH